MNERVAAVLPSRDEAATVGAVAQAVDNAVSDQHAMVINADSSMSRDTREAFEAASLRASRRTLPHLRRGKGTQALRAMEDITGADCVMMIDTDTRDPSAPLYRRLVDAVLDGADLALLDYTRTWFEGNLTNHVARPLVAANAGSDIPQPIVGDIALSRRALEWVLHAYHGAELPLRDCVDGYGIDAFITQTVALAEGIVQSLLTGRVKRHAPSFPHLPVIFAEAVPVLLGAAGIAPLRVTTDDAGAFAKRQEETLVDMVAAAAGIVIGQRGRDAPVARVSGVRHERGDDGVRSMPHHASQAIPAGQ